MKRKKNLLCDIKERKIINGDMTKLRIIRRYYKYIFYIKYSMFLFFYIKVFLFLLHF